MSANLITSIIGYMGLAVSYTVSIPQLLLMWRTKNVEGLSALSWALLLTTDLCYLTRALYIKDPVFIFGKLWAVIVVSTQLYLILRYRKGGKRAEGMKVPILPGEL